MTLARDLRKAARRWEFCEARRPLLARLAADRPRQAGGCALLDVWKGPALPARALDRAALPDISRGRCAGLGHPGGRL